MYFIDVRDNDGFIKPVIKLFKTYEEAAGAAGDVLLVEPDLTHSLVYQLHIIEPKYYIGENVFAVITREINSSKTKGKIAKEAFKFVKVSRMLTNPYLDDSVYGGVTSGFKSTPIDTFAYYPKPLLNEDEPDVFLYNYFKAILMPFAQIHFARKYIPMTKGLLLRLGMPEIAIPEPIWDMSNEDRLDAIENFYRPVVRKMLDIGFITKIGISVYTMEETAMLRELISK